MSSVDAKSRTSGYAKQSCRHLQQAYLSSCRMELAVSGFAATGVFPFNRNIFTPEDFIADNENSQRNESIGDVHEATGVSDGGEAFSSVETPTQLLQTGVKNLINDLSLKRNINSLKKRSTLRQKRKMILHAFPVKEILEKEVKNERQKNVLAIRGL